MTAAEQADRTARNTLDLVQARRQLAAVREYADTLGDDPLLMRRVFVSDVRGALDRALATPPPTSSDPREVTA